MLSRVSHMTILSVIICMMNVGYQRATRLSQALVHLVTARASLFMDQRVSGLPIRATSFLRQSASICLDKSSTVSSSSSLKLWSSKQGVETFLSAHNIFQRTLSHDLPCCMTTPQFLREVSLPGNFSVPPAENRDSNIFLYSSITVSFDLHSR